MKKRLLFLGIAASGLISYNASAQLALETFNAGTPLPAGWVMIKDAHTVSSSFTTLTSIQDSLDVEAYTPVAIASATDYCMITTSLFTPSATANRWLITPSFTVTDANMVIQWDDYDLGSGEPINVKVSPTAGTTAGSFTVPVYHGATGPGGFVTHYAPVGAYMGTNIRVAFVDDTTNNWGFVVDNVQTTILPGLDLGVSSLYIPSFVQTGSTNAVTGIIHNYSAHLTNSFRLNYSVNGAAPVTTAVSPSPAIALGSDYTYTSSTPWHPTTAGVYTLKVWGDEINSVAGVDEVHSNDTLTAVINVLDTLQPKLVMIEEFTQASCDPCANAAPNVDSVYANNIANTILVRYHVNFPGRDCMDSVTLAPFVQARLTYYGVSGVPDAKVDGYDVYPGAGSFTTALLQGEASIGSPFKITVTPNYNAATHTYSFSAAIKSYGVFPSGYKAYAVLTVDKLTYALNQSTETIPQLIFPEVAEAMLPNSSGTTLAAFTTGSTQTISASWVKNHPWGSNRSVWSYDSTSTGKIIVWIEDANKFVYQAGVATVSTIYTTDVNTVKGNIGNMNVYPNPATNTTTIALNLTEGADVKMEVFNMAGQLVYSTPVENRSAGTSISDIDVSNFASGEYLVRVSAGSEILTKKVSVIK